jgi:hypothetical protein
MTLIHLRSIDAIENARVEYEATHDAYLHYDNFTWQVGSILIAAVFIYWGFLLDKQPDLYRSVCGNLLICLMLSIWLLYATYNRTILLFKLHRIAELEVILGMEQHRRFRKTYDGKQVYPVNQPKGHYLDMAVYVFGSIGGPVLTFAVPFHNWDCVQFLSLGVIIILTTGVCCWVYFIDKKTDTLIDQFPKRS